MQQISADGVITEYTAGSGPGFNFVVTTFIVLPPLIALFFIVELKYSEWVNKHFKCLEHSLFKAIFLFMITAIFCQKARFIQVLTAVLIAPIIAIDAVAGV